MLEELKERKKGWGFDFSIKQVAVLYSDMKLRKLVIKCNK